MIIIYKIITMFNYLIGCTVIESVSSFVVLTSENVNTLTV